MTDFALLKSLADASYKDLLDSIDGVTEAQAWAKAECQPGEYLHSEGSILSLVAHVASCKQVYGSVGYRDSEIRWRDTVARLEQVWPDWEAAKRWLDEAHSYWMSCWANEHDAEKLVPRFRGELWPSWKIIWTVVQHDSYHAAQINMLRSTLAPATTPPPDEAELWREACRDLPSW